MGAHSDTALVERNLNERGRREAERRAAITAATVHEAIRLEGEEELDRPPSALAWSGFAAGLSMGFSLVAQGVLFPLLPDAPWRLLVVRAGYTVGFFIVVLGRQQLFTENTLTPIILLLSRRGWAKLPDVIRLWAVVLATNLAGAILFSWIVAHSRLFSPPVHAAFAAISRSAVAGDPWTILLRAIFAGWLIALMVWLLPFAAAARVTVIAIITYLVGVSGFAHVVAGAVDVSYLVVTGALPAGSAVLGWMLPTLAGNIIGGVAFVAILNHAQVTAGAGGPARGRA